jgi:hypothetical protein
MSIRLDPRRLGTLKQLSAEANMRPGDLVRQWVEERIDAARGGARPAPPGSDRVLGLIAAIEARLAALEAAADMPAAPPTSEPVRQTDIAHDAASPAPAQPEPAPETKRTKRKRATAAPSGEHVALHDEMIAVLRERGPLSAADLASAVVERGRYAPPRSKKPLDAAMVSQRVSNPTYRPLFTRAEGRIGLAE